MYKYMSGGKVDVSLLADFLQREILKIIDQCDGTKAIVRDECLASVLNFIDHRILSEHNVITMSVLHEGKLTLDRADIKNIIFITRPHSHLIDMVAENIYGFPKLSGERRKFHLVYVPRTSLMANDRLMRLGVYGEFTIITELTCAIFPFDSDLMSMEIDSVYKDYYLDKDPGSLYLAGDAIVKLEELFGRAGRVVGKGDAARQVWDVVSRLRTSSQPAAHSVVDTLVLIDRASDLLSPLATQLTYEGLIDEIFSIQKMIVKLPAMKFAQSENEKTDCLSKKSIPLNSGDSLYTEIRGRNFNAVGSILNRRANELSAQMDEKNKIEQSVQHMKQFVARLPQLLADRKSLSIHTTIAQMVREVADSSRFMTSLQLEQELMLGVDTDRVQTHIEDLIAHQESIIKVLRLIGLQSVTNSGLKTKVLEYYIREIVQTYGFKHLLTMSTLKKTGILKTQTNSRSYAILRKALRLTLEDNDEVSPTDISYVHSIYAPLSVRLIQAASSPSRWKSLGDVLDQIPGPSIEHNEPQTNSTLRDSAGSYASHSNSRTVLVFFIGGCTFAEIAALRFLSKKQDSNTDYVIATTKIINGDTFLESLLEKQLKLPDNN